MKNFTSVVATIFLSFIAGAVFQEKIDERKHVIPYNKYTSYVDSEIWTTCNKTTGANSEICKFILRKIDMVSEQKQK